MCLAVSDEGDGARSQVRVMCDVHVVPVQMLGRTMGCVDADVFVPGSKKHFDQKVALFGTSRSR